MTARVATRLPRAGDVREAAADLLERTRGQRGLPRTITDAATIEQLAAILRPGPEVRP